MSGTRAAFNGDVTATVITPTGGSQMLLADVAAAALEGGESGAAVTALQTQVAALQAAVAALQAAGAKFG